MAISPATLAIAIPAATKVASAAIEQVGQGLSFKKMFGHEATATATVAAETPTIRQQLDSLAKNLRQWLSEQGIQTPYEIQLSHNSMDSKTDLSVQGIQGEQIRSLLAQDPQKLSALKQIASSIQAISNNLGSGMSSVSITDLESTLTY